VYDLLEGLRTKKSPRPDFEDGVRNQVVLDAIEKAADKRRWVKV
jgi:hypothetical protein